MMEQASSQDTLGFSASLPTGEAIPAQSGPTPELPLIQAPSLLEVVLACLVREQIRYCFLRDDPSRNSLQLGGEIDVLIRPADRARLTSLLRHLGFTPMRAWGHAPHSFYVGYDASRDVWVKLDVVDRIAFGAPIPVLVTALGDRLLENRQPHGLGFVPKPEDACVALLLHCVLDKGNVSSKHRDDLKKLCDQVRDEDYVTALLAQYWSEKMSWHRLARLIRTDNWLELLAEQSNMTARLDTHERIDGVLRRFRARVLRKLNRLLPRVRERPLSVALLAPDGAGKSTLARGLSQSFCLPVRSIYMGLYEKSPNKHYMASLPGSGLTLRLLRQWGRYLTGLYHRMRGRFVIFDRYTYDALLGAGKKGTWLKRWRRLLLAHACPAPDLVIILDAPADVMFARKREHSVAGLAQQRQEYLELRAQLPACTVVDATVAPAELRREVTSLMWRSYTGTAKPLR